MKTSRFFMYLFMVFAITLTACSEDGEDGMDGMDGAPGAQGPAGEDGQDGEDGNANVVSITIDGFPIVSGINNITIPEVTQDIVDNGLVLGYTTVSGNPFWETLPVVTGGSVILDIDRIFLETVRLTSTFNQTLDFRFLIIEGTPLGRQSGSTREYYEMQGVDFNDYESVKEFFNL
ncbi:collagen-like protein [Dokdonia sinensis]|uniref:collagen-like protein n=1 Tax=Dokdonia sinensis TaxID=2479847 RepID=UPI00191C15F8|nr:collagen-like protein [Dokdonia sinensis]